MSTLAYGVITTKRIQADAGHSTETAPPGTKVYLDALAALVPAEVLALSAFMTGVLTETVTDGAQTTIRFEHPLFMERAYWALTILAVAVYLAGRKLANGKLESLDLVRGLIPAGAFFAWGMLIKGSGFELITSRLEDDPRAVLAAFIAVVLGLMAALLGYQADREDPPGT